MPVLAAPAGAHSAAGGRPAESFVPAVRTGAVPRANAMATAPATTLGADVEAVADETPTTAADATGLGADLTAQGDALFIPPGAKQNV